MDEFKKIATLKNKWEFFLEKYTNGEKSAIFCGGGGAGCDWAIRLLKTQNIVPEFIIDNNSKLKERAGIPVISMKEGIKKYKEKNFFVLVTTPKYERELTEELKRDIAESDIFCFETELYFSYIHNLDEYRKYINENAAEFKLFTDMLVDEKSKSTLFNVLAGRITGDFSYFREVYEEKQYFAENIITLTDDETFIDVGACDGDTLEIINELTMGKAKKIYCFEPDRACFEQLSKKAKRFPLEIELIKKGAWNKQEILCFEEDASHGASKVIEENQTENKIELDKIDNIVCNAERITHIKMDIEGSEYNALLGAKETIIRCKPKLAICVYHKNEDILEIYKLISQMVPEYKFYLRHHNVSGTETVLYAVI